ncbi:NrfD/PsrC family molybdoenzyme membrane anchor subunit [Calditrichota bacterium GD2]
MHEIEITSGRMNPEIDPVLHAWSWPIPLYLFLGGLVAGLLFFSALFYLRNEGDKYKTGVKIAPMFAPFFLSIGLLALLYDLSHVLYAWKLFTTFRIESPMSWGAWTLAIIFPLSILWSFMFIKDVFPHLSWNSGLLDWLHAQVKKFARPLAGALIILSLIVGIYTGILLSAFNARPFWNTSILGPLFLTSGLSTGTAFVILLSRDHHERLVFSKIDMGLIAVEMFLIIHLFMGFLASTQVHEEAAHLFLGGPYTAVFWTFVFVLGLLVPFINELLEWRGYKIPSAVTAVLVLIGGLIFRFIVVDAGQSSRWLYKFMESSLK